MPFRIFSLAAGIHHWTVLEHHHTLKQGIKASNQGLEVLNRGFPEDCASMFLQTATMLLEVFNK
ncbi:hypothetical protein LR48_Vigan04g066000 [Vigna angularis]|uniref:Uncharacterized protein n=1 Tax=Phaseolus angularis TaxID=3914 RepID=A0A0L9UD56_PHAAN|nr:hypothetical protein LR48_Vigan04g066000 [Vigna angularis]